MRAPFSKVIRFSNKAEKKIRNKNVASPEEPQAAACAAAAMAIASGKWKIVFCDCLMAVMFYSTNKRAHTSAKSCRQVPICRILCVFRRSTRQTNTQTCGSLYFHNRESRVERRRQWCDLVATFLTCSQTSHPVRCDWLGGYKPTPQRLMPRNILKKQQNNNKKEENTGKNRVSAYTPHVFTGS